MRRTLLILAIGASLALAGCSAIPGIGSGGPAVKGGLCEQDVAAAARSADPAIRTASLDLAIRACTTLQQWVAAVTAYGGDAVSPDARSYLAQRCAEPTSGVSHYMLCGLLAESMKVPAPTPTHKSKHKPKRTPQLTESPASAIAPPPVGQAAPVPPAP